MLYLLNLFITVYYSCGNRGSCPWYILEYSLFTPCCTKRFPHFLSRDAPTVMVCRFVVAQVIVVVSQPIGGGGGGLTFHRDEITLVVLGAVGRFLLQVAFVSDGGCADSIVLVWWLMIDYNLRCDASSWWTMWSMVCCDRWNGVIIGRNYNRAVVSLWNLAVWLSMSDFNIDGNLRWNPGSCRWVVWRIWFEFDKCISSVFLIEHFADWIMIV